MLACREGKHHRKAPPEVVPQTAGAAGGGMPPPVVQAGRSGPPQLHQLTMNPESIAQTPE